MRVIKSNKLPPDWQAGKGYRWPCASETYHDEYSPRLYPELWDKLEPAVVAIGDRIGPRFTVMGIYDELTYVSHYVAPRGVKQWWLLRCDCGTLRLTRQLFRAGKCSKYHAANYDVAA